MQTKHIVLLVVILAFVAILFSQEKAATIPSASGYQLISVPITTGPFGAPHVLSEAHRVFLVDSVSGKTWEYVSEHTDKDNAYYPAFLLPVEVRK